jgi:hypothetical protein
MSNNIEMIGSYAFYGCTSLANISMSNSMKVIGADAFSDCISLVNIRIPESVTTIYKYAFCGCTSLKSIIIPENVTSIGRFAFGYCDNLKTVYYNAINCTCTEVISDDGASIYPLFYQGTQSNSIEKIIIGDKVTNIPEGIFAALYNIKEINIPDSVKIIEYNAFSRCNNVTKLNLGNGVEEIGKDCFDCLSISELTIPKSVKIIDAWAFYKCELLETLTISENVEIIGRLAFEDCTSLKTVYYNAINCKYYNYIYDSKYNPLFLQNDDSNTTIKNIIIGNRVENIPEGIFSYLSGITEITLPEKVTSIGCMAFKNCTNLETVYYNVINASYAGINESCSVIYPLFPDSNVTRLIIGNKVKKLDDGIFGYLDKITEITLPESLESIGAWTFSECTNLKTVYYDAINCSTDNIYKTVNGSAYALYPFQQQDSETNEIIVNNIKNIIIGENVEIINKQIFEYCGIETITIPKKVNYIATGVFWNCTNLKNITIKNSLENITLADNWTITGVTVTFQP